MELRSACLTHFLDTCYQKLDEVNRETRNCAYGGATWEAARQITQECALKAADYSRHQSELSNLERARLLDIMLWASQLSRRLRRSPRTAVKVPIRLISEMPGCCWSEETHIVDISTHGVQIICKHAVKIGDLLSVHRFDTGEKPEGRVVWLRKRSAGFQEIGIEFHQDGETAR
jgi:hypothetical protein